MGFRKWAEKLTRGDDEWVITNFTNTNNTLRSNESKKESESG